MAFRNTKALNRIQSVVFDTAYKTNENLLICAPTGAGKTNIAMLTILRTIHQYVESGVIRKDKFKVSTYHHYHSQLLLCFTVSVIVPLFSIFTFSHSYCPSAVLVQFIPLPFIWYPSTSFPVPGEFVP